MKKLAKTALVSSLIATTVACSQSPFSAKEVPPATDTTKPADTVTATDSKAGEASCGGASANTDGKTAEAKCGEGKCGGAAATTSTADKTVEAKCGEGKCGGAK